jgi:hypothetical protein
LNIKLLTLLFIGSFSVQGQTIPNGNFENWTVDIFDNHNPYDWETSNADWQGEKITNAPGYLGLWALKTINYFTTNSPYAKCRFPVSNHPSNLTAYVKTTYSEMDSVKIEIIIYYNGLTVDSGEWINTSFSPITSWIPVSISISRFNANADSAEIRITGGIKGGTSLYVDELSFIVTEINENKNNNSLHFFPNPATDEITIKSQESRIEEIEIYDVMGGKIKDFTPNPFPGRARGTLVDISTLSTGIYFVKLRTEDGSVIKKLIKQ